MSCERNRLFESMQKSELKQLIISTAFDLDSVDAACPSLSVDGLVVVSTRAVV